MSRAILDVSAPDRKRRTPKKKIWHAPMPRPRRVPRRTRGRTPRRTRGRTPRRRMAACAMNVGKRRDESSGSRGGGRARSGRDRRGLKRKKRRVFVAARRGGMRRVGESARTHRRAAAAEHGLRALDPDARVATIDAPALGCSIALLEVARKWRRRREKANIGSSRTEIFFFGADTSYRVTAKSNLLG